MPSGWIVYALDLEAGDRAWSFDAGIALCSILSIQGLPEVLKNADILTTDGLCIVVIRAAEQSHLLSQCDAGVVFEAPCPVLSGFLRSDHGMVRRSVVLASMLIGRIVAAERTGAFDAEAEV